MSKIDNEETPLLESEEAHNLHLHDNPHRLGWLTILIIFGLLGGWAIFAKIEMSVNASGKVISEGYKKMVQHPQGGLVTSLAVKEGDRVKRGDIILKLNDIPVDAKLKEAIRRHDRLLLDIARLQAESKLSKSIDFSQAKRQIIEKERLSEEEEQTRRLFESGVEELERKIRLLKDRNHILRLQNSALKQKIESDKKLLLSYEKELKKWQSLYDRNMTDELKLLDRERKIEQIKAKIQEEESQIEQNLATIEANKNQIALEQSSYINQARKRLKEGYAKLDSLKQLIRSLKNAKEQLIVRAPDSGIVTDLKIHGAGEVVPARAPIAYIVPDNRKWILELYIKPQDIDKVHVGELADIHFPSYVDPAAKPIEGKVIYVSADTIILPNLRKEFYKAKVVITPKGEEAIRENGFNIIPGMPASAYIKAGKRSFMSYILLPIEQLVKGAFHAN